MKVKPCHGDIPTLTGGGVQWSTVNEPATVDDDFTFLHAIVMLCIDAVVYSVIAWYVGFVWPSEMVQPLPWNFPFRVRESSAGNMYIGTTAECD